MSAQLQLTQLIVAKAKEQSIYNGHYTLTSPKGGHFTFEIKTVSGGKWSGKRNIALLTGSNNTEDYTKFGVVDNFGIRPWPGYTAKPGEQLTRWEWFARIVYSLACEQDQFKKLGYSLLVSRKCFVCNRLLTNPASVLSGIGEYCAKRGRIDR